MTKQKRGEHWYICFKSCGKGGKTENIAKYHEIIKLQSNSKFKKHSVLCGRIIFC